MDKNRGKIKRNSRIKLLPFSFAIFINASSPYQWSTWEHQSMLKVASYTGGTNAIDTAVMRLICHGDHW
ncbi:hypothetical protein [Peribacillus simplex]|uniref:hypothetical protein n=1 Tax=Peribacillus simplex TaxID=1478 RepID=UPI003D2B409B